MKSPVQEGRDQESALAEQADVQTDEVVTGPEQGPGTPESSLGGAERAVSAQTEDVPRYDVPLFPDEEGTQPAAAESRDSGQGVVSLIDGDPSVTEGSGARAGVPLPVEPRSGLGQRIAVENDAVPVSAPSPAPGSGHAAAAPATMSAPSPPRRRGLAAAVTRSIEDDPVRSQPFVGPPVLADSPPEGAGEEYYPTWRDGYFPTLDDKLYLGDQDAPRGYPLNNIGPDFRAQAAAGPVAYSDIDGSFYTRHAGFFDPLERGLRQMEPWEGMVYEFDRLDGATLSGNARWPFFTSRLDPDKAHVKAGPLYLDLMSVGAGVLYSDYRGTQRFAPGEDDGWLSYLSLDFRAYLRATENFYLSAYGRLIYLPGVSDGGFRLAAGDGGLGAHLRFAYHFEWGEWDFLLYDEFRAFNVSNLYASADDEALERAGRYQFGIPDNAGRSSDFFADDGVGFSNKVGLKGVSPWGDNWRKEVEVDHTDYWRGYDFGSHSRRDHLGALAGYSGTVIPFSPYARYDLDSYDGFDTRFHRVYLGGNGRLTENVTLHGRVGYLWTADREPDYQSALWHLSAVHRINQRTSQILSGGQDFFTNDFIDDHGVRRYLRYDLNRRLSEHVQGGVFAQWSKTEPLGLEEEISQEIYGARLSAFPWDYTHFHAEIYQQRTRYDLLDQVNERLIVTARSTHQIFSRTSLQFYYRFEDAETFDEHLYGMEIRRYF